MWDTARALSRHRRKVQALSGATSKGIVMDVDTHRWLSVVLQALQLFAIVVAVVAFLHAKSERQRHTADEGRNAYIDYLSVCLNNIDLNVFEDPLDDPNRNVTPEMKRRESIVLSQLISLFQLGWIWRKNKFLSFRAWKAHMRLFLQRPNFREIWAKKKPIYEAGGKKSQSKKFARFLDRMIAGEDPEE
jgi:hypothetical protein